MSTVRAGEAAAKIVESCSFCVFQLDRPVHQFMQANQFRHAIRGAQRVFRMAVLEFVISVPASSTTSGLSGYLSEKAWIDFAERQACGDQHVGVSSVVFLRDRYWWPNWQRIRAQRTAVVRFPARDCFPAGVTANLHRAELAQKYDRTS